MDEIIISFKQIIFFLVKVWQKTRFLRSLLNLGNCSFYPTCSDYFIESINIHGLLNGFSLATKRILRCHPLCKGGIDEVPKQGLRIKDYGL